jgi:hypothetical protein
MDLKLLAMVMCIACVAAFGQDQPTAQQRPQAQLDALYRAQVHLRYSQEVVRAISRHEPIQLPDAPLGPKASITAMTFKSDDGYILRLRGVEIRTDSLILQADALAYMWATGEIEPSGNVRLIAIP